MTELRNPICFARLIWNLLRGRRLCSGHKFSSVNYETPDNILIIKWKTCGCESVGWSWGSLEHEK